MRRHPEHGVMYILIPARSRCPTCSTVRIRSLPHHFRAFHRATGFSAHFLLRTLNYVILIRPKLASSVFWIKALCPPMTNRANPRRFLVARCEHDHVLIVTVPQSLDNGPCSPFRARRWAGCLEPQMPRAGTNCGHARLGVLRHSHTGSGGEVGVAPSDVARPRQAI